MNFVINVEKITRMENQIANVLYSTIIVLGQIDLIYAY